MKDRRLVLLATIICLLLLSVPAAGQVDIFVSTFSGESILSVDTGNGALATVKVLSTGSRPEDMTVGPDNKLYICDPTNGLIMRMELDGTMQENVLSDFSAGPQGPRFNFKGDLFFSARADGSGVFVIPGAASVAFGGLFALPPTEVISVGDPLSGGGTIGTLGGEGIAFAINGDLLVVDKSNERVLRSPAPAFLVVEEIISGLDDPTGIAVNRVGQILVSNGGSTRNVVRCGANPLTPTGLPFVCHQFAGFAGNRTPFYLETFSDGTTFVAVSRPSGKGEVWKIDPLPGIDVGDLTIPGTKTLLVALPNPPGPGNAPPIIGLADPATSKLITKEAVDTTTLQTLTFNFGSHVFGLTFDLLAPTDSCTISVDAVEINQFELAGVLTKEDLEFKATPYAGKEGWIVVYGGSTDGCTFGAEKQDISIAAFTVEGTTFNPAILKASTSFLPLLGDITVLDLTGFYIFGTVAGIPDDAVRTSRGGFGSEFVAADIGVAIENGFFCDFLSPIAPPVQTFDTDSNIPIKFQIGIGETGCLDKNFLGKDDEVEAILSVSQVELPNGDFFFDIKDVTPSGSSNELPRFRAAGDHFVYDLHLRDPDGTPWAAGMYAATVISNAFEPPKTIFFCVDACDGTRPE